METLAPNLPPRRLAAQQTQVRRVPRENREKAAGFGGVWHVRPAPGCYTGSLLSRECRLPCDREEKKNMRRREIEGEGKDEKKRNEGGNWKRTERGRGRGTALRRRRHRFNHGSTETIANTMHHHHHHNQAHMNEIWVDFASCLCGCEIATSGSHVESSKD